MAASLVILAYGLSNWLLRGGGIEQGFYTPEQMADGASIPHLKTVHALLVGASGLLTGIWWLAVLMALAQRLGQSYSLFRDEVDDAFRKNQKSWWAQIVCLRSASWCLPLMVVVGFGYSWQLALLYLPALFLMPLCYSGVWFWFGGNKWFNAWTVGEQSYGGLHALPWAYLVFKMVLIALM
jgi:hypothetical protein